MTDFDIVEAEHECQKELDWENQFYDEFNKPSLNEVWVSFDPDYREEDE